MLAKLKKSAFIAYGLMTRAMTLGVRAVIFDQQHGLFLVRHTYVPGWHLPGGGVERHETLAEAVDKEVREEANIKLNRPGRHFHTYKNTLTSRFDHVALFICEDWTLLGDKLPDREIAESGFFPLDRLPTNSTEATRARIDEIYFNRTIRDDW